MNGTQPRHRRRRTARRTMREALVLAAVGCASLAAGCARHALPPAPVAAFDPGETGQSTVPAFYWIPAWRIYLREGDVVEHRGRQYTVRAGQWHVAEFPVGSTATGSAIAAATPGVAAPRTDDPSRAAPLDSSRSSVSARDASSPAVVTVAMRYVGTRYAWGGTNPAGFDCSGFVQYVYARLGVSLPRTVREQYGAGSAVTREALEVGDVVFFDRLRHNGIYIGDGRFIHATRSGDTVRVSALDENWFQQRWVGARRLRAARDR